MNVLANMGINTEAAVLVLTALVAILLILVIILFLRMSSLYRRYDRFMRGKDAESLEDTIAELCDRVLMLQEQDLTNKDIMKVINRNLVNCYQKTGLVKYNAFDGMGGQSSFAVTMLNLNNTGFILNVIHNRASCYIYLKEVHDGVSDVILGEEEKESLAQALKKKDRVYDR